MGIICLTNYWVCERYNSFGEITCVEFEADKAGIKCLEYVERTP
jgi:hypothetical protein